MLFKKLFIRKFKFNIVHQRFIHIICLLISSLKKGFIYKSHIFLFNLTKDLNKFSLYFFKPFFKFVQNLFRWLDLRAE